MGVEQKRELAKTLRGVSYDARTDRFTAEIILAGERKWLGSYHTAQEAADAYVEAAALRPKREKSQTAFAEAYAKFRQDHGGDRATPLEGAELVYDGQVFVFVGLIWRKVRGVKYAFFAWDGACQTCGAGYRTMTPAPVSVAKGITRNCHSHTNTGGRARVKPPVRPTVEAVAKQPPSQPSAMSEHIAGKVEVLAMIHDRIGLADAAQWIAEQCGWPGRVPREGAVAELIRAMVDDGTIRAGIDNHGDLIFE